MRTVPRLLLSCAFVVLALVGLHGQAPRTFRVWVFADAHVGSDQKKGRESLATALRQSEEFADLVMALRSHISHTLRELAVMVDGGESPADGEEDLVAHVKSLFGAD